MAKTTQDGWRLCRKCQGLYLSKDSRGMLVGKCPASAQSSSGLILHDDMKGPAYVVRVRQPSDKDERGTKVQLGWKYCGKCTGLFYARNPDPGPCPAGGKHDGSTSQELGLRMVEGSAGMHSGWRWCRKCQGMFCFVYDLGVCPAGGKHDATQSAAYFMRLDAAVGDAPPDHSDWDIPTVSLGGGTQVSCQSHLTLRNDGSVTLQAVFHDAGLFEYNTSFVWTVKDCWNVLYPIGLPQPGHVSGTFEPGSRDWSLPPTEYHYDVIKDNWNDLAVGASAELFASANMDAVNILMNAAAVAGLVLAVVALK